jgi:YHS domain-containing protein
MKNVVILSVVAFLITILPINTFGQDKNVEMKKKVESTETKTTDTQHEVEKKTEKAEKNVIDSKPINKVCPVSGEEIDPKITTIYNSKTYALCCKSCLKKFNKNPGEYVLKLSEDGKSIKKNK